LRTSSSAAFIRSIVAGIADPGYNPQRRVTRLRCAGRNPAEHSISGSPIWTRKKNPRLGAAAISDVSAKAKRCRIAISKIERAGDEDRLIVNILPGRGRIDHDLERGRHGV
jgi:hypothetical protein